MKPGAMTDQKEAAVITAPVVEQVSQGSSKQKYKVALVALAAVTVLAVVGAFVGVFYMQTAVVEKILRHQHLEYQTSVGEHVSEDVEADVVENTAKFTMKGDDGEMFQVIEDYGTKIAVMSLVDQTSSRCIVYTIKTNMTAGDMQDIQSEVMSETDDDGGTFYLPDKDPIAQPYFLSTAAKSMCAGMQVFWAREVCQEELEEKMVEDDEERRMTTVSTGSVRVKRGWVRRAVSWVRRTVAKVVRCVRRLLCYWACSYVPPTYHRVCRRICSYTC